jgi:hypothetical protein
MLGKFSKAGIILGSLVLLGNLAHAQSTSNGSQQALPPVAPLGAARTVDDLVQPGDSSAGGGQPIIPDSRPLAGIQDLTLGSSASGHNFLLPSFTVVTQLGSNSLGSGSGTTSYPGTLSTSFLTGRLGLNQVSGPSELLFDYVAGSSFSNDPRQGNSLIQGLGASEALRWSRWFLLFSDDFDYLSDSSFGFGGLGGLKNFGVPLGNGVGSSPGISTSFAPGDSVFINGMRRINNVVAGQANYALSHRSSLTIAGSYSVLDYSNSGLLNSGHATFQGGYDYLLSRRNSVSFFYTFDTISFSGSMQTIQEHSVQAAFARRIAGALSWEIGGGPSIVEYQTPLSGSGRVVTPTAFTALKYRLRYTAFSLHYRHGLTNGSGVLLGSQTDDFSGTVSRTFGKNWDSSIETGFARNQAIGQTVSTAVSPKAWYTSARLERHFVGYGALFLAYSAWGQSSLTSICTLPSCKVGSLISTGSVGYTWGLRPVKLE